MDVVYQIFGYLPLKYKNPSDMEYFGFLAHSVEQNYEAKNYHFALVALHMIYMGAVYHYLFRIHLASPTKFNDTLIGFHHQLKEHRQKRKKIKVGNDEFSWHDFSSINEKTIFQFYRAVGLNEEKIGNLRKPVEERNDAVHTNGVYFENLDTFEAKTDTYLKCLGKIDDACGKFTKKLFKKFQRALTIVLLDQEEAEKYLLEDFIPNNSVSSISLEELSEIGRTEYAGKAHNKDLVYNALQKITEK